MWLSQPSDRTWQIRIEKNKEDKGEIKKSKLSSWEKSSVNVLFQQFVVHYSHLMVLSLPWSVLKSLNSPQGAIEYVPNSGAQTDLER